MEKQYQHIICDPVKCVGCGDCELACSMTKHQVFDPSLSRIRTVRIEPIVMLSVTCRTCADAPCVLACPRNALTQDAETGIILVDNDLCDGCGWCIEACDFGAILLNAANKRVEICDLCADLDEPQCIKFCQKDALSLSAPEVIAQQTRREVVSKLLAELIGQ
ncbi:MAG: 4Fe-4S dicluster domain-containing protein [Chloroflexi bacterium]|nr:4Fe-4S dicluster domain-containing protein [Chloroflexota bacterium]